MTAGLRDFTCSGKPEDAKKLVEALGAGTASSTDGEGPVLGKRVEGWTKDAKMSKFACNEMRRNRCIKNTTPVLNSTS